MVAGRAGRGTLAGLNRTGATVADAAAAYVRFVEVDRQRKASTIRDYKSAIDNHILPVFAKVAIEDLKLERWQRQLGSERPITNRQKWKIITIFHGLMERPDAFGSPRTRSATSRSHAKRRAAGIDVFSAEEVHALLRATEEKRDARRSS